MLASLPLAALQRSRPFSSATCFRSYLGSHSCFRVYKRPHILPRILKLLVSWWRELRTGPVMRRKVLPLQAVLHQKVFCSFAAWRKGKKHPEERGAEGRGLCKSENTGQGPRQEGIQRQTVISQPNLQRYYSQGASVGVKTAIHHGANTGSSVAASVLSAGVCLTEELNVTCAVVPLPL